MRYYYFYCAGLTLLLSVVSQRQALSHPPKKKPAAAAPAPVFSSEDALRSAIYDSAVKFEGKTENSDDRNRNEAAWIAAINRFNGLPARAHYCASAFYYVHAVNGVRLPVRGVGLVRSYFSDPKRIIYKRSRGNQRVGLKPRRMDAVSLYASHIEAIAQATFDPETEDRVRCIGFNTKGGKGTRDGCYINWRKTAEIKAIANFLTPYYKAHFSSAL